MNPVIIFLQFVCFIRCTYSSSICKVGKRDILNNCSCSLVHVSSLQDLAEPDWNRTTKLVPDVEYLTDAILTQTPWIQFGGCWKSSKPEHVLATSGIRLSGDYPISECLQFVNSSRFYLWGSRCIDEESAGVHAGEYRYDIQPCNASSASFCLTGQHKCVCQYDVVDIPSGKEIGSCKSVSFSYEDSKSSSNPWKAILHTENCDSKLPFFCLGGNFSKKNFDSEFKFFEDNTFVSAALMCTLYRLNFVSITDMHSMPLDFRKRFLNSSVSYWSPFFREERMISGGNRLTNETENCVSVTANKNQTAKFSVRSCQLTVLNNDTECSLNPFIIGSVGSSEKDFYEYFYLLLILVIPMIVIAACVVKGCCAVKTTGYADFSRKDNVGRSRAGQHRPRSENHYHSVRLSKPIKRQSTEPPSLGASSIFGDVPTVRARFEMEDDEPQYMEMKKKKDSSVYVTLELKFPLNRPNA